MLSRLGPMTKVARMLLTRPHLTLNWFRAKGAITSDIVEGFNTKVQRSMRTAYNFRSFHGMKIA